MFAICLVVLGVLSRSSPSFACYSQCSAQCGGTNDSSCIPTCMSSCQNALGGAFQSNGGAVEQYGAIAFSNGTMNYGFSFNRENRQSAETIAMEYCANGSDEPNDCKVATWFYNHCAALATKANSPGQANGSWAAEHASSRRVAEKMALASCRKYAGHAGKECKIIESFCAGL